MYTSLIPPSVTKPQRPLPSARAAIAVLVGVVLGITFATEAEAACFATSAKQPFSAPALQFAGTDAAQLPFDAPDSHAAHDQIVGMWNAEFLIGDGPLRYDQSLQQFHSDGTEVMISNGLPPALGNICAGVWKRDAGTVKLRHMTWNWDANGHLTGTFVMVVTLQVDRRGNSFRGTWSADSYDLSNNVIPELHAEGVVRATRITVD
jgi:hypothetical protein